MSNIRGFILGFGLSVLSFYLYDQTLEQAKSNNKAFANYKIELFKEAAATPVIPFNIAYINKTEPTIPTIISEETVANLTTEDTTPANPNEELTIAFENENINGIEDEEILNINTDDIIPIEINNTPISNATIATDLETEKVAMLPSDDQQLENTSPEEDSPWVIAKTRKKNDNNTTLEENNLNVSKNIEPVENFIEEDLSYEVAKKIKQNIIFPIPEEILNDENLTPTFINPNTKESIKKGKEKEKTETKQPTLIEKKVVETQTDKQTNIINNISSWFNKPQEDGNTEKKAKSTPPVYSSQETPDETESKVETTKNKNLGDFYEALQKTKEAHNKKKITPSELKLSFNNDRAEISGQTLRWIKAFSEKTNEESSFIQVMLDATASAELQRKRLNLLYTIFINNNVDLNKVDTVFSNVEPNTFIIRTLNLTKPKI